MNRINKYQENIKTFIKNKGFLSKISQDTQNILNAQLETSDHIAAILCLTVLNSRCKKYNLKIHGYYVALAVDILMIMGKIYANRDFYDTLYNTVSIDNATTETTNWLYWSIAQNIETLMMNKTERYNPKTLQLCMDMCVKYMPQIFKKSNYTSNKRVKRTDIYSYHPEDHEFRNAYKKKTTLSKTILQNEINNRYGAVCCLAISLGWLIGQGDEAVLDKLDNMGKYFGTFLKVSDDFIYLERDVQLANSVSTNYVINYGIKESYSELIESHIHFMEELMKNNIDTKTMKEIIDIIMKQVDDMMGDISVDMETQYNDDCSSI